ncbi:MAG: hypothetical protein HYU81_01470 [Candidatus Brennerbacteria bacterium]|nr:hypothetical protein [Candidatus Brennerbacteria bacterium]
MKTQLFFLFIAWFALGGLFLSVVLYPENEKDSRKNEPIEKLRNRIIAEFVIIPSLFAVSAIFVKIGAASDSHLLVGIMTLIVTFDVASSYVFFLGIKHYLFRKRFESINSLARSLTLEEEEVN